VSETLAPKGLPSALPPGERLLWQGSPDWRALARRTFHGRALAVYFAVLLAWVVASRVYDGTATRDVAVAVMWFGGLALAGLGLVSLFAWLTARTTVYTVTDRRVVMSYGIALTMSINLPLTKVATAALRLFPDGTADIPLAVSPTEKIAFAMLWPHARPWHFARPEPSLRAVSDGATVAAILARALAAANARPVAAIDSRIASTVAASPVAAAA
jgi:hypothetical protein